MEITDRLTFDAKDMRLTSGGYLVASPRVARTGIQVYGGHEVGRPDLKAVRIYRPEDQVFARDSLHTFAYKPITNDHPPEEVTAQNWRDYAVGQSGAEIARDGEFIRVPMVVMDAATIAAIQGGKAELSVGYSTDLKWTPGVTPDGQEYDAIQTAIRANHIAVVSAARGGPKLRIGDEPGGAPDNPKAEKTQMSDKPLKSVLVDGLTVDMTEIAAAVVEKTLKGLNDSLAAVQASQAKDAATITTLTATIGTKDAEIETLKKQLADATLTPEKIQALVADRAVVVSKAQTMLGDAFKADGKSEAQIRREVVSASLGDAAKDWNDEQIRASFDTLSASVKPSTIPAQAKAFQAADGKGAGVDVWAKRDERLRNGYKGAQAS